MRVGACSELKVFGRDLCFLRALAQAAGTDLAGLIARRPPGQPRLICASDDNHGVTVTAAARFAGAPARMYLHEGGPETRVRRIVEAGAEVVGGWHYNDAV